MEAKNYNRGSYKPPKPKTTWKPGHKCGICGQEMLESQLSKNSFEREYETRWGVHIACQNKLTGALDRNAR